MMRPLPWRRMWGTTARVIRTIPKKFVSKIDSGLFDRALFRPGGGDTEAGVVHEQVDAALQPHHLADGGFDRFIAGHVEGQHLERSGWPARAPRLLVP